MDLGLSAYNEVGLVHQTLTPSAGGMMKHSSIKGKTKRSRACSKSAEEMEIDRMIHIEVERNRRKQMNEHVQALRQLMPPSYVQKGDQASIIGGAIEFVKELKHILECFEAQKRQRMSCTHNHSSTTVKSINANNKDKIDTHRNNDNIMVVVQHQQLPGMEEILRGKSDNGIDIVSSLDYVGVILIGLDVAVIKILSQRGPKQLLKIIDVLQNDLFFTILSINITTMDQEVFYSFEVKGSINQLYPAEEIAILIQNMFDTIHASNIKG